MLETRNSSYAVLRCHCIIAVNGSIGIVVVCARPRYLVVNADEGEPGTCKAVSYTHLTLPTNREV